ncbi:hypothetical protein ACQ33O_12700 [Ferruginibacter sp. SUN002]|uniref:hypothetical protein n=1 Tax=Ferruginibacter sp. SUN002 TaxID=2937789 RepID=UPI003D36A18E
MAKLICWKLWLADRLFPLVPPFDFLRLPAFIHTDLFGASIVALLLLLRYPRNRFFQIALITIEVASCLLDQNRWQPWEYQYIFTLLIFMFNKKNEKDIKPVFIFLLASIYFYSGLGKINPAFLQSIWYTLLLSKQFGVSYDLGHNPFIYNAGYLLGLIEIVLGLGLLSKRTRKHSAILLIVMHLIILVIFGPFGLNYDHVIWPWNVAMIAYFIFLLSDDIKEKLSFKILELNRNPLIVVLFGIMPFFSLFGGWDYFLSSSLFSSRPTDLYICLPINKDVPLNRYSDEGKSPCDSNSSMINVRQWAFDEMMVPAYPQRRVYLKIKKQVEDRYHDLGATFYIYTYRNGKKVKEVL